MAKPNVLALIPARGGSKGIRRKNLRMVAGLSLIERAVRCAASCDWISRLVVTTDDCEIAERATSAGAEAITRPENISGDTATSEAALLHALDHLEDKGYVPDVVAFIQCTAPLMIPSDIDGVVRLVSAGSADSAFVGSVFRHFIWKESADGDTMIGVNHESHVRQMRQQRSVEYLESGSVYAMRTKGFRLAKHRFFGRIAVYPIPYERTLEIDDEEDLVRATHALTAFQYGRPTDRR